jgi:RNA polymerase sigma-70 factor (ECF subfamily)
LVGSDAASAGASEATKPRASAIDSGRVADAPPARADRGERLRALLAQIALGDQRAFEALYKQASPHLFAVALRILRHGSLAEDVLQEAFVSVWHHAATYDAAKSHPLAWLTSIVRNRCLDRLRRRELDTEPLLRDDEEGAFAWEPPSDAPSPVDLLLAAADTRAIRSCIDTLDPGPRQAIALAFFEGLSHRELAAQMRQPLGTVKSWVRRGLATLRRCLDAAGFGG